MLYKKLMRGFIKRPGHFITGIYRGTCRNYVR